MMRKTVCLYTDGNDPEEKEELRMYREGGELLEYCLK